jgi:hypothetical protein
MYLELPMRAQHGDQYGFSRDALSDYTTRSACACAQSDEGPGAPPIEPNTIYVSDLTCVVSSTAPTTEALVASTHEETSTRHRGLDGR